MEETTMSTLPDNRAQKVILFTAYVIAIGGLLYVTWLFFWGTTNPVYR